MAVTDGRQIWIAYINSRRLGGGILEACMYRWTREMAGGAMGSAHDTYPPERVCGAAFGCEQ